MMMSHRNWWLHRFPPTTRKQAVRHLFCGVGQERTRCLIVILPFCFGTAVRSTNLGLYSESEAEKIRVYVAGVADNDPSVATTYATERANNPNLPRAGNATHTYDSQNGILVHKSTQATIVTSEAADDTADNLVKAYRSTLNHHNMGSQVGLKAYAKKHRHIHGGFGSLLERKWQNRPLYTSKDFAAVKLEPAVAAFIAHDNAAGTYSDCFVCLFVRSRIGL